MPKIPGDIDVTDVLQKRYRTQITIHTSLIDAFNGDKKRKSRYIGFFHRHLFAIVHRKVYFCS